MSNFKDVYELNSMFKIEQTSSENTDWEILESQLSIIEEEFEELKKAVKTKDWHELKDAMGDVLVTTYGMGYRTRVDCDQLMTRISYSNFSKVCKTQQEVDLTVKYYTDMGCKVYVDETTLNGDVVWAIKSAEKQTYTDSSTGEEKTIPAHKFLKCVKWEEPDLTNVEMK